MEKIIRVGLPGMPMVGFFNDLDEVIEYYRENGFTVRQDGGTYTDILPPEGEKLVAWESFQAETPRVVEMITLASGTEILILDDDEEFPCESGAAN